MFAKRALISTLRGIVFFAEFGSVAASRHELVVGGQRVHSISCVGLGKDSVYESPMVYIKRPLARRGSMLNLKNE
jgi:ethanolamine transporter EutH